ncbi:MAG TPA: hypothetical protein VGZ00_00575 [Candidatus Baltobacteraceae bacterium]|jgi:hypothetical protein|nr:hypothetical protein [Candidatus Baltobacteraceae bacterium]
MSALPPVGVVGRLAYFLVIIALAGCGGGSASGPSITPGTAFVPKSTTSDVVESSIVQPPNPILLPPVVYAVDSTGTLFGFDVLGNQRANVKPVGPFGHLNGGGIATDGTHIVITDGSPSNELEVYTKFLVPAPPTPACHGLLVPRGIAYDPGWNLFFIGNGGASITSYGYPRPACNPLLPPPNNFPGAYGPSGVAYDTVAKNNTIWVANYAGYPTSANGVIDYWTNGTVANAFNNDRFIPPHPDLEPYSIAVCPGINTPYHPIIAVGFIDDGSGKGVPFQSIAIYTNKGIRIPTLFPGVKTPNSLSCNSQDDLYDADDAGLLVYTLPGSASRPNRAFPQLTRQVYGVLVTN